MSLHRQSYYGKNGTAAATTKRVAPRQGSLGTRINPLKARKPDPPTLIAVDGGV